MVDGCPLGFQLEEGLFFLSEELHYGPVQVQPSVEGQTIGQLAGPEAQDMLLLQADRSPDLLYDWAGVPMDRDAGAIEVAFENAIGAREGTPFDEVDSLVAAADVASGARAVPDDLP